MMVSKRVLAPFGVSEPVPAAGEQYATVKVVAEVPYVVLDGPGSIMTPCTATTKLNDGDRVIVRIANHRATVTGNLSSKAVDERAADEIERAAAERAEKIKEAVKAVEKGVNDAYEEIGKANKAADDAAAAAERAQQTANNIGNEIEPIKEGIDAARSVADDAAKAIEDATKTVLAGLKDSYDVETDAATFEGTLGALIEASAGGINSKVSREEYQKNTDETNKALGDLAGKLYSTAEDLDSLKEAEGEAKRDLEEARLALAAARKTLDDLEASGDATAEQLEASRATVAAAEAAVAQGERNWEAARAKVEAAARSHSLDGGPRGGGREQPFPDGLRHHHELRAEDRADQPGEQGRAGHRELDSLRRPGDDHGAEGEPHVHEAHQRGHGLRGRRQPGRLLREPLHVRLKHHRHGRDALQRLPMG